MARNFVMALVIAVVGMALSAPMEPAWAAPYTPNEMLDQFNSVTGILAERAQALARQMFLALFALELAVSAYGWAIEKEGMDQVMKEFATKVIVASVIFFFVNNPNTIINPFVNGLEGVGARVAGGAGWSPMEPSEIMYAGVRIGSTLWNSVSTPPPQFAPSEDVGWIEGLTEGFTSLFMFVPNVIENLMSRVVILGVYVVLIICFAIIAAQMVLAKVEMYIILSAGAFFLGFAVFRITAGLAENVLKYAVSVGVKLFFLQVMAKIAEMLTPGWELAIADSVNYRYACPCPTFTNPPLIDLPSALWVLASVGMFAYLAWKIPGTMASRLTGDMQIGVTRALWGK